MATPNPKFSKLAKQIYGSNDARYKDIEKLYTATESQINDIIGRFVDDQRNWAANAPKAEIREFMQQLKRLKQQTKDKTDITLLAVAFTGMRMRTNGDLAKGLSQIQIVKLAKQDKQIINEHLYQIPIQIRESEYPKAVNAVKSKLKADLGHQPDWIQNDAEIRKVLTKGRKYTPDLTDKAIQKIVNANSGPTTVETDVNKTISDLINKTNDLIEKSVTNKLPPQQYKQELAKLFEGKGTNGKAALGRAESILRTHGAYTYVNTKYDEFKARGAKAYIVLVGSSHPCGNCLDRDGTVFKMSQFEPGTTAPPFHANCQCDIEETTLDDFETL